MSNDPTIDRFEALLAAGQDNALLRLTLGQHYLAAGDTEAAEMHLRRALDHQPGLAAAWKFLGKTLAEAGNTNAARDTYDRGIEVAQANGDKQLVKEMTVFRKRLDR